MSPSVNDMFPSKYLKADDLRGPEGRGWREFALTIVTVAVEEVGGGENEKEEKWVLHFERAQKGMVLNKTNAQTIAEAYGDRSEDWVGQKVVLFVTTVATPQGSKPGIRIRIPAVTATSFDPDEVPV